MLQNKTTCQIMAKELWEFVEETAFSPDKDNLATRARYEKDKQNAMATLVMGIQSHLIYLVTSCTSPNKKSLGCTQSSV